MSDSLAGSGYDYQGRFDVEEKSLHVPIAPASAKYVNGLVKAKRATSSNTVSALEIRIDKLEKQLERQRSSERISANTSRPASEEPSSSGELSAPTQSNAVPAAAAPEPPSRRPSGRFLTCQGDASSANYFGPTSLETGMLDFKDFVNDHQDDSMRGTRGISVSIENRIDSFVTDGQCESIKTDPMSPPTGPPFAILDAMIESYFATVNYRFPIWSKSSFTRMVSSFQVSLTPEQEWASIVCCNNLILITLTANSMRRAQQRFTATETNNRTSSVDFDLITGFLTNAKRAIGNVQLLLAPRLNNVQALLSLCIVAQEYLSTSILEALFALTVQCAKASGLYHWQSFQSQLNEESIKEFHNVALCLYVLDKEIGWVGGSFPNIPSSEMHLRSASAPNTLSPLALRTELSAIEESVFFETYTSRLKYRVPNGLHQRNVSMIQRLDDWLARCNLNINGLESEAESNLSQAELVARYFCVKLLIVWPYRDHTEGISTECVEVARSCMTHLLRMWSSALDLGHSMTVPKIISSYPPLYLYAITTAILEGRACNADEDSLRSFADMIDAVAGSREDKAYRTRLKEMTRILIEAVNATDNPRKRRKTIQSNTNRASLPLSPQSYIHASPAAPTKRSEWPSDRENEFVSLGSWGHDHHYFDTSGFDGLVLQSWDDPFTLVSNTTGGSGNTSSSSNPVIDVSSIMDNWLRHSNLGRSQSD